MKSKRIVVFVDGEKVYELQSSLQISYDMIETVTNAMNRILHQLKLKGKIQYFQVESGNTAVPGSPLDTTTKIQKANTRQGLVV